jgi:hypothetical protein
MRYLSSAAFTISFRFVNIRVRYLVMTKRSMVAPSTPNGDRNASTSVIRVPSSQASK